MVGQYLSNQGCTKASWAVNLSFGSMTSSFLIRSLPSSEMFGQRLELKDVDALSYMAALNSEMLFPM